MKKQTRHTGLGFGRITAELRARDVQGPDAIGFERFVLRLIQNRGYVGAIQYLDDLGMMVTSYLACEEPKPTKTWVSRLSSGLPKRIRFASGNRKALRSLSKAKRAVLVRTTSCSWQQKKFLSAVNREHPDAHNLKRVRRLIVRGLASLRGLRPNGLVSEQSGAAGSLWELCASKILCRAEALEGSTSDKVLRRYLGNLESLASSGLADSVYTAAVIQIDESRFDPDSVRKIGLLQTAIKFLHGLVSRPPSDDWRLYVGNLVANQEPGGKLRVAASPHDWVQCALRALYAYLSAWLRCVPEDCCHQQSKGVHLAEKRIRDGDMVWSFDLSSATDMFPVALMWPVLDGTDFFEARKILKWVVNGAWKPPVGFPPKPVRWAVGQPLGVLPSFAWFSLSHHALIRGLGASLGIDAMNQYAILGDDIVIFHPVLASSYASTMASIGVEVSPTKSWASSRFAEFAGCSILADGAFSPGKWREPKPSNLISKALDPDYNLASVVPRSLAKLIDSVKEFPYPIGLRRPTDDELRVTPERLKLDYYRILMRPYAPSYGWKTRNEIFWILAYKAGVKGYLYPLMPDGGRRAYGYFWPLVRSLGQSNPPYFPGDSSLPDCGLDESLPTIEDACSRAVHQFVYNVLFCDDATADYWAEVFPSLAEEALQQNIPLDTRFDWIEWVLSCYPYVKVDHLTMGNKMDLWRRLKRVKAGKDVLVTPGALASFLRHPLTSGIPNPKLRRGSGVAFH